MRKKVLVAMSGGVDSSVAALMLKEQGYELSGITMRLGVGIADGGKPRCCGPDTIGDAGQVCERLGISHHVFDFGKELEEKVISPFVAEYARGRTPNPCVECNRRLKFGALLDQARALGFDYLATGHYADIARDENGFFLKRPRDRQKDQTYFLYRIAPEALESILFPLSSHLKSEVREMALKARLPVAVKRESQDLCFVTRKHYPVFFAQRLGEIKTGPIVDRDGKFMGMHRGIVFYTVGQRGGLGISHPTPLYVLAIDAAENRIVAGERRDLRATGLIAGDPSILVPNWPRRVHVKIRYRKEEVPCTVRFENGRLQMDFAEGQEAVTPGQSAVCYDGDKVLGGGVIETALRAVGQSR